MQSHQLTTLTVLSLMLSPLAAAAPWMVAGTSEPDTPYDSSSWMWQSPPTIGQKRVYFNVITQGNEFLATGATINPNVGALETRNEAPMGEFHEAVLGEWLDCNGDGYIGMAETALREYPSELLSSTAICPPTSGSIQTWVYAKGHNYNGIVSELIPVSRDVTSRDTRVIEDATARVWGDFDRPDEDQRTQRCPLRPLPRGTAQTTGGALNYLACNTDLLGNANDAFDAAGDPAGLRFANERDARSSPAGQLSPFGSEDSSHAAASVQDCSQDPLVRSGDVLNTTPLAEPTADQSGGGPSHNIEARPVSPAVNADPTTWTVPGQYNQTSEEIVAAETGTAHNCNTGDDRGADFYGIVESDNPTIDPKDKRGANWNFFFDTSNRGGAPVSVIEPGNAGMNENDLGTGWGGSRWIADSLWGRKPGPGLVKADLGTAQVGPADAYWLSFFAYVGSNVTGKAIALPGGPTGAKYGAWHCGSFTSGLHHGWNCDTSTWYMNPDGSAQAGFAELERSELVQLGQTYQLRDVDCYDGSNKLGVATQPAGHGTGACP